MSERTWKKIAFQCAVQLEQLFSIVIPLEDIEKKEKMKISLFCSIALLSSSLRQTTRHFMQFNLSLFFTQTTQDKKKLK
jgi:hypothetical protein